MPARGASVSGASVAPRQVTHTKTVAWPAGPMSLIPHLLDIQRGVRNRRESAAADSRTVEMDSTVAEAPRPARDQRDGRSPGSRVSATCRLPDLSLEDRNQWHRASAHRLQLRGQPWIGIEAPCGARCVPHSLITLVREAIKGASTTSRPHIVNGNAASALHYCRC